eukprot:3910477-Lingulodinium_polyedra.AAC.1
MELPDAAPLHLPRAGLAFVCVEQMVVFGMALDRSGSTRAMVARRERQARKAWRRVALALCNEK